MNFENPFSRITLDSTKDWDRIKDNITRTLLQAIDQKCAEGNLDPALKEEVTQRTLEVSSPSPSLLSILSSLT